jgi:phage terminase large subunit-like protein
MIHEPYVRRVIYGDSFMTYMTKGHDAVDISMGIGDECHDWPDASIKNRIESAMGNRLAPTFSTITTAGFNKDGYCFSTLRDTGIKILEGTLEDEEQLILIFELDEADDWKDADMWVKSNPNLPYSLSHKPYLDSEFKKALNEAGATEVNFKTKNLNMWVDAPVVWIQNEIWKKNAHGINKEDLKGLTCYGGLDLARTVDLNAFVLWFANAKGDVSAVLPFFWIPEAKVNNHHDRVDYQKWIDQGHMFKTPGNVADYSRIAADIMDIAKQYDLKSIAYDPFLTGHGVLKDLVDNGLTCHELRQNIVTLNMPTKELERIVTNGKLEHFNNPVLSWMMGNVILTKDTSGNVKPDKGKSEKKIDGVSAMINALAEFKTFGDQQITLGIL